MSRAIALPGQFQQVAETVTMQLMQLLCTDVLVTDDRGVVLASSEPAWVGFLCDRLGDPVRNLHLRLPIEINGQAGEVLITAPSNGETLSPRLIHALVELMINQATMVAKLPRQHELKNKFIHDLLRGEAIANEAEVLREAQILGMDFTRPRAVILVDAADYLLPATKGKQYEVLDAQTQRQVKLIISSIVSFFHLPDDTICAYIGGSEIVVLKATSTQDLQAWTNREDLPGQANPSWANLTALKRAGNALLNRLRSDTGACISLGIGRYHPGIPGLAQSYQDARAALSLGRRFRGHNQVHCLDCLGVAAFVGVSDESTKIDLAKHLLSPLDREPELIETLDVFFAENCYPSSTASRLSIHRNTLSYRLDKITSLTGLNPRQFDAAVQIRLALLVRSLQGDPQLGICPTIEQPELEHLRQMPNVSVQ